MSKDRKLLSQLLNKWAQDHTIGYVIADSEPGDRGVSNTGMYFSWLVRETDCNIDLLNLLDRLDEYVDSIRRRTKLDGMFCCKCGQFYDYAEANQSDGSMICYACRQSPYK
jgi:hypothetical protein